MTAVTVGLIYLIGLISTFLFGMVCHIMKRRHINLGILNGFVPKSTEDFSLVIFGASALWPFTFSILAIIGLALVLYYGTYFVVDKIIDVFVNEEPKENTKGASL